MWFAPRQLLGSSQRTKGLAGWRSRGNTKRHARNNRRARFSVRGPRRQDIRFSEVHWVRVLEQERMERVLGSQERRVRLKIYCEPL
jgi:hypothetical protein